MYLFGVMYSSWSKEHFCTVSEQQDLNARCGIASPEIKLKTILSWFYSLTLSSILTVVTPEPSTAALLVITALTVLNLF